jgi:hypothetical protein
MAETDEWWLVVVDRGWDWLEASLQLWSASKEVANVVMALIRRALMTASKVVQLRNE